MTKGAKGWLADNVKLYKANYHEFLRIFGVKLSPWWDNMTGFDIIKFDEDFIKTPDFSSMRQTIQEKYGEEGVDILVRLIDAPGEEKDENEESDNKDE